MSAKKKPSKPSQTVPCIPRKKIDTHLSNAVGSSREVPPTDQAIRGRACITGVDAHVMREYERELLGGILREALEASGVPRVESCCTLLLRLWCVDVVGRTRVTRVPASGHGQTEESPVKHAAARYRIYIRHVVAKPCHADIP